MQEWIEQAADLIVHAQRVVVFTGAGVSKESGLPTFRDAVVVITQNVDDLHRRADSSDIIELR